MIYYVVAPDGITHAELQHKNSLVASLLVDGRTITFSTVTGRGMSDSRYKLTEESRSYLYTNNYNDSGKLKDYLYQPAAFIAKFG